MLVLQKFIYIAEGKNPEALMVFIGGGIQLF